MYVCLLCKFVCVAASVYYVYFLLRGRACMFLVIYVCMYWRSHVCVHVSLCVYAVYMHVCLLVGFSVSMYVKI